MLKPDMFLYLFRYFAHLTLMPSALLQSNSENVHEAGTDAILLSLYIIDYRNCTESAVRSCNYVIKKTLISGMLL